MIIIIWIVQNRRIHIFNFEKSIYVNNKDHHENELIVILASLMIVLLVFIALCRYNSQCLYK